ncbi:MAG: bifunctional histidinol-phosphatase/imidazoleglycerol-phosphate dehydratase HisB [Sphingobacteriaceae bacterium]|nr:bifunctional histidinol-phosphatase/imidazoleglycerol-phosphate dehydratase HisB [Sphingobacteriaceae bacterium]
MKKKVLFIDRDGTLIVEPKSDFQIDSLEKLEFIPGAITSLANIARELDYELVMVSNQDGLGTSSFPEETFWPAQNKMLQTLTGEGITFAQIHIDKSFEKENKPTRKPNTGMLLNYFSDEYDLKNSFVIGDRITDIQLAKNLGAKAIFIMNEVHDQTIDKSLEDTLVLKTSAWNDIYVYLKLPPRTVSLERNTQETKISISLNLDGSGNAEIKTALAFFDHMLDQIAKHAGIDLKIDVIGDLQVDEHHTIEDTAIALGECLLKALGNKKGIERYAFVLPMDDCLAQVALDFGGRSWLVWDAKFNREKIGEMPTEMFFHFFKSFSDAAKCNLNVKAEGENEHHKIEAIFKALAKCIKQAVKRDENNMQLPSTKGLL